MSNASSVNGFFASLAVVTAGLIVYGSFFPFHFYHGGAGDPLTALWSSRDIGRQPVSGVLANIALYLPLGVFGVLALDRRRLRFTGAAAIFGFGTCLSCAVELAQFYDYGRITTLTDVYANALGTFVGAWIGLWVPAGWARYRPRAVEPVVLLLLGAFTAAELFPLAPSLNTAWYWDAIASVWRRSPPSPVAVYRHVLFWLVAAALIARCVGVASSRWFLPLCVAAVFAGKVVVISNWLTAADVIGAAIALSAWFALSRIPSVRQALVLSVGLVLLGMLDGLRPWHWTAVGQPLHWTPFTRLLHQPLAVRTHGLIRQFFVCGSLIWTLSRTGMSRYVAGVIVVFGLLAVRLLQTHLTGFAPDMTGVLMAVLITLLFARLSIRDEYESDPSKALIIRCNSEDQR